MGSMSVWHWIIVLAVGLLLFGGRGKISELMGDFAKGIKSFKKGLAEEPEADPDKAEMKTIDHQNPPVTGSGSGTGVGAEASRKAG
jgi:sec-independent protein translocase protein TatA